MGMSEASVTLRVYERGRCRGQHTRTSEKTPLRPRTRRVPRARLPGMGFIIRVVINAFAIWVVTLITALQVTIIPFPPGDTLQVVLTLLLVAVIFALVNT